MSKSATEKTYPWPPCSTTKMPSETEANLEADKKFNEGLISNFNPKLFNEFLDNVYLSVR